MVALGNWSEDLCFHRTGDPCSGRLDRSGNRAARSAAVWVPRAGEWLRVSGNWDAKLFFSTGSAAREDLAIARETAGPLKIRGLWIHEWSPLHGLGNQVMTRASGSSGNRTHEVVRHKGNFVVNEGCGPARRSGNRRLGRVHTTYS